MKVVLAGGTGLQGRPRAERTVHLLTDAHLAALSQFAGGGS